jgi:hypothetical protein
VPKKTLALKRLCLKTLCSMACPTLWLFIDRDRTLYPSRGITAHPQSKFTEALYPEANAILDWATTLREDATIDLRIALMTSGSPKSAWRFVEEKGLRCTFEGALPTATGPKGAWHAACLWGLRCPKARKAGVLAFGDPDYNRSEGLLGKARLMAHLIAMGVPPAHICIVDDNPKDFEGKQAGARVLVPEWGAGRRTGLGFLSQEACLQILNAVPVDRAQDAIWHLEKWISATRTLELAPAPAA